ncbi:aldo/keto reductase family protein [Methylococcus geothermalis]|uniref:Aldo/keto reductase n=1 Tax=Methylococcus geothermalis TaxID=2681310 RepID=A0A858Q6F5_9GAMM|nr:aldo/keto reductase [Methylococcus geothermalis]QJD29383.1 aldo/keto reductase [Methylococcus geothermalis]
MKKDGFLVSAYGVRMPGIVYGTAWKKDRTAALVEQAVSLGFRGIDTACQPKHYDEAGVGTGLAACLKAGLERADFYLQSKFTPVDGQDPERMPYDPKASLAEQVAQSFETSLKNLRTPYLDCLILHSPLSDEKDTLEVWRAMEAIFDSGRARQLGISNCYQLERLERLYGQARVRPAVVQNRFCAETRYEREIREFCRQNRIIFQSFWTLTANPSVLADATLRALASNHGRTPAQVFFRYLTQIGIVPLTGTTSETHMREDLAIFDFELTENECEAVAGLLRV